MVLGRLCPCMGIDMVWLAFVTPCGYADAITEDGQALELVGILFNPEKLATFLKNKFAAPLKRESSLRSGSRS